MLAKALAQKVLQQSRTDILLECIDLASYEAFAPASKHIRCGAAKVVEIVAEKQPELVAPHLGKLFPAFSVQEPQTRWMIIRVMGFCAHLNKPMAQKAIPYAEIYINKKEGLCIASSADLFLGDMGAISKNDAQKVFPLLEQSMDHPVTNEQDWLLEAFYKVFPNLEKAEQEKVVKFSERWQYSTRKSTQQRARKILRLR
ncbi:MAG: hypothetical protein MUO77_05835 [Anaerolineales bacterium]|nr:hypothetical protein [Anaerolineales bacterium]